MKQLIFCFLTFALFFSACKKANLSPIEGTYSGKMTKNKFRGMDTVEVKIQFVNKQFSYLPNGCKGSFETKNDKIIFSSQDCSCWCDCRPNVDCGGDIIISEYDFTIENEHLIFTRNYSNTYQDSGTTIIFDLKRE
jgi:hypothetical protein